MAQCYNLIDAMKTPKNKNLLIEEHLEIVLVCFSMENENFSLGTRRKMFIFFFRSREIDILYVCGFCLVLQVPGPVSTWSGLEGGYHSNSLYCFVYYVGGY